MAEGSLSEGPLFLAALESEVRALIRAGAGGAALPAGPGRLVRARLGGRPLWVGWSGMGPERAGQTARWVAAELRPSWVLLTGYAGGTLPGQGPGQLVAATEVRRAGAAPLHPTAQVLRRLRALGGLQEGVFETFETAVCEPAKKLELGQRGLCAVEMETHAAATELAAAGLPWGALRVILDSAAHSLRGIERFTTPRGGVRPAALAGSLLRDPALALRLLRLARARRAADRALAAALLRLAELA